MARTTKARTGIREEAASVGVEVTGVPMSEDPLTPRRGSA